MFLFKPSFALFLVSVLFSLTAFADEAPDFSTERLSGNWGGYRTDLYNSGVSVDAVYKQSFWRNFSGGVKEGNSGVSYLEAGVTVDAEKAANLKGTTFYASVVSAQGGNPDDFAGTNGGIDNTSVTKRAFFLYEAYVEKKFMTDRAALLLGVRDLNYDFNVTDTSGLFLNSTYGISTEFSATGDNGPSVFPATALGARLLVTPIGASYLQLGVFDGVPGDPNGRGTHIRFKDKEGALLIAEGGVNSAETGKFAIGAWNYTARRPDQQTAALKKLSRGFYLMGDKSVYSADNKDVSAFARVGFTAGDVEQYKSNWSLGFVMTGFVPSRSEGQLGFAVSQNRNSSKYKIANAPVDSQETGYEITYSDKATPWLTVQPDLQYTVNPGTDPTHDNAWTGGVRFTVDF